MRVGIGSQADPAHEAYEAPCPDCKGTGALEELDDVGVRLFAGDCPRCEGDRIAHDVRPDEVVTVPCPAEDCEDGAVVVLDAGDTWHSETCPRCDGNGDVTGPAGEVCS